VRAGVSDACTFRSGMGGVVGGSGSSPSSKSFWIWLTSLMHSTHPHFISVHFDFCMLYMTVAMLAQHKLTNIPSSVGVQTTIFIIYTIDKK
jgi:hypothetical protein